ncbi:hypothetical protein CXG81DRAFT_27195 [Caulochytrium protostelioides]|uniref:RGS domain-containing protein n=1 Tax=Caulochytrium protostelioides TaxID=1555241 RepID=A0A4V1IUC6_9FUNG|nr:hypothetical protein CXG81DRAFT_27195 [Caulochytrium protostelioides]|eukprot:RKP00089.1 hypothetical protein CXG81DRAFT_27195 [Caulochytrium protostelioides]
MTVPLSSHLSAAEQMAVALGYLQNPAPSGLALALLIVAAALIPTATLLLTLYGHVPTIAARSPLLWVFELWALGGTCWILTPMFLASDSSTAAMHHLFQPWYTMLMFLLAVFLTLNVTRSLALFGRADLYWGAHAARRSGLQAYARALTFFSGDPATAQLQQTRDFLRLRSIAQSGALNAGASGKRSQLGRVRVRLFTQLRGAHGASASDTDTRHGASQPKIREANAIAAPASFQPITGTEKGHVYYRGVVNSRDEIASARKRSQWLAWALRTGFYGLLCAGLATLITWSQVGGDVYRATTLLALAPTLRGNIALGVVLIVVPATQLPLTAGALPLVAMNNGGFMFELCMARTTVAALLMASGATFLAESRVATSITLLLVTLLVAVIVDVGILVGLLVEHLFQARGGFMVDVEEGGPHLAAPEDDGSTPVDASADALAAGDVKKTTVEPTPGVMGSAPMTSHDEIGTPTHASPWTPSLPYQAAVLLSAGPAGTASHAGPVPVIGALYVDPSGMALPPRSGHTTSPTSPRYSSMAAGISAIDAGAAMLPSLNGAAAPSLASPGPAHAVPTPSDTAQGPDGHPGMMTSPPPKPPVPVRSGSVSSTGPSAPASMTLPRSTSIHQNVPSGAAATTAPGAMGSAPVMPPMTAVPLDLGWPAAKQPKPASAAASVQELCSTQSGGIPDAVPARSVTPRDALTVPPATATASSVPAPTVATGIPLAKTTSLSSAAASSTPTTAMTPTPLTVIPGSPSAPRAPGSPKAMASPGAIRGKRGMKLKSIEQLELLWNDPVGQAQVSELLRRGFAQEMVRFLEVSPAMLNSTERGGVTFSQLYATFIAPGAPLELNISGKIKEFWADQMSRQADAHFPGTLMALKTQQANLFLHTRRDLFRTIYANYLKDLRRIASNMP